MEFVFFRHTKIAPLLSEIISPGQRLALVTASLYELAKKSGYEGNILHCAITEALVTDENPYTLSAERRGTVDGTLRDAVLPDLRRLHELFSLDLQKLGAETGIPELSFLADYHAPQETGSMYSRRIRDAINTLAVRLSQSKDAEAMRDELEDFYAAYGVGMPGLHKAFRIDGTAEDMKILPHSNRQLSNSFCRNSVSRCCPMNTSFCIRSP